ncbi:MAG: CHAT domain-containing protein [Chthoniobacterales bacterium]
MTAVAEPTPAPSDPIKTLAVQIADAPGDHERDALLEKAEPAWLADHRLRKELVLVVYERSVAGDYLAAEALGRWILRFLIEQHDAEGIAAIKTQIAGSLREFGDLDEADVLLHEALDYYEKEPGNSRGLVATFQALGIVDLYRSDFARALGHVHQALTTAQSVGYHEGVIPALNTTGEIFRMQGEPARALEFYQRARAEVGDDSAWNMAFIFNNIGQSYEAMGDTAKALDFINRGRAVAERVKMRPRVATSLAVIGNLHLVRHEVAQARASYEQSRALSVDLRDRAGEARAALGLANCAYDDKDFNASLEHAQQAAELWRTAGQRTQLAAAQTLAGRSLRALGRIDEARVAFERAITQIEQVRTGIAGGAVEAESFFSTQVAPYEEMVSLLVQARRYPEALAMAERASARTLLDIVAGGKPDFEKSMTATEREHANQFSRKIAELNHAWQQARNEPQPNESKISALQSDLVHAREAHENFQAELLALHPNWKRAVSSAQPATIAEINQLAADRSRALLKFVVTESETLLFVLRANDSGNPLQVFSLKLSGEALAHRVAEFREKLAMRSLGWQEPARQLYEALLKESEPAWKDANRIVLIPDGQLWELPFQALQGDGHCLMEDRAISYAPSLSFLSRSAVQAPRNFSTASVLAVGNPALGTGEHYRVRNDPGVSASMSESWQPLPATERQLGELKKIYGKDQARLLEGQGAREEDFKSNAPSFDILHLATHGVLNNHAPMYSYLLFAQTNLAPGEDGLLEARELMQMNLCARLAVLSACETARGRISAGEGVIGLSWAFLVAGCPTTVVSHWKVDSESNTELMIDFHQRLHAGATPAAALRAASMALAKRPEYRHPFYWAAFAVVGDSR